MSMTRQSTYDEVRVGPDRNGQHLNESSILNSRYSLTNGSNGFRDIKHRNCCHRCWAWARDGFTIISTCFAVLTLAITIALTFQLRFGRPQVAPEGAVAADDGECSAAAGLAMLRARGSAVDAAIAALLCCSVTHPHAVGVGGGGVMLVHDHLQMRTRVIDFLPDIPAAFDPAKRPSDIGGGSVAVPGFLQGLEHAHQHYGKLQWRELFQPAIHVAREGFIVSASLEAALDSLNTAFIPSPASSSPGRFSNAFEARFLPFGVRLRRGTKFTRRPYAELLEKVAEYGPKAVFDTDFSVEVVKLLKDSGSSISVGELQDYQVEEYDALQAVYGRGPAPHQHHQRTVYTVPHPAGGPQLLAALHLMHNTPGLDTAPLPEFYRRLVQATTATGPAFYRMASEPDHRYHLSSQLLNISSQLGLHQLYGDEDKPSASHLQQFTYKKQQLSSSNTPDQGQQFSSNSNSSEIDDQEQKSSSSNSSSVTNDELLLSAEQQAQLVELNIELLRQLNAALPAEVLNEVPQQAATQVSVIDTYDLYVSAVCGLGSHFGSQLMTAHGVLFNNMLASVPRPPPREGGGSGARTRVERDVNTLRAPPAPTRTGTKDSRPNHKSDGDNRLKDSDTFPNSTSEHDSDTAFDEGDGNQHLYIDKDLNQRSKVDGESNQRLNIDENFNQRPNVVRESNQYLNVVEEGESNQRLKVVEEANQPFSNTKDSAGCESDADPERLVSQEAARSQRLRRQQPSGAAALAADQALDVYGEQPAASVPPPAVDPHRSGRVRPLIPYAPFVVVDTKQVCGLRVVCSSSSVSDSLQVLAHHLLRDLSITASVAQPRLALQWGTGDLLVDDLSDGLRLPGPVRNFLTGRGYSLAIQRPPYGSVNTVAKQRDSLQSHSDTRGGGLAARLGGDQGDPLADDAGVKGEAAGLVDSAAGGGSNDVSGGPSTTNATGGDNGGSNEGGRDPAITYTSAGAGSNDAGTEQVVIVPVVQSSGGNGSSDTVYVRVNDDEAGRTGSGMRTGEEYKLGERLYLGEKVLPLASPSAAIAGSEAVQPSPDSPAQQAGKPSSKTKDRGDSASKLPEGNKKFMGDAVALEKSKQAAAGHHQGGDGGSPHGTGIVVKGDKRGRGNAASPAGARPNSRFINGGRDSNSDVNLFTAEELDAAAAGGGIGVPATVADTDGPFPPPPAGGGGGVIDSVFSDYDPLRHHTSQVRLNEYDPGAAPPLAAADYIEAPVNIWGQQHRQIVPLHPQQFTPQQLAEHHHRKLLLQQQLLHQQQQQNDPHGFLQPQQQQPVFIPLQQHQQQQQQQGINGGGDDQLPPGFAAGPTQGLPVVFQQQNHHLHPVLGSRVSGRYSDIRG